ncbi:nucleobindin-2 isoform X2 [Bacillus rossius redtenbacheri]|uniref:nucleobindin-2 isoform X2 n=1 Tax=Bacillus rossius redtenbacheri TaxID=93214 RepID=UPI002FDD5647
MKWTLLVLVTTLTIQAAVGPPVTEKKVKEDEKNNAENEIDSDNKVVPNVEYDHYLKEVVSALESDPEFRAKLEKAEDVDIRSGKIAQELEFVSHNVRTKLDELKRQELERLRHLAKKEYELKNGMDTEHLKIAVPEHLDHANPHTFETEDLRKLIAKTSADLAEADRKRQEEFKQYEMQKEFEKQEALKTLDEENKKKLEEEYQKQEEKHKKHEPLHHPGSKQQLEEVWEKQDHMENQEFDPKTFFFLHDLDGNGFWDQAEVKALFLKELDKLYNSGAPEDDMRERIEEMERMREHVFKEADTNKDNLISFQEFMAQTKKPEFEKDQGWQSLDQQQLYTPEEYQRFEHQRQMEVQKLVQQGLFHPAQQGIHPNQIPQGYYQGQQYHPAQGQPIYQQQPQYQQHAAVGQGHQQVPQGHQQAQQVQGHQQAQQVPQGHQQAQQVPQGHLQAQQVPQGHLQAQQVPQGHLQAQQVPQGHLQAQQVPQGHPQGHQQAQQVPQGHQQAQQVPQGHLQAQQMPQGHLQAQQVPQGHPQGHQQAQQVPQGQQPQVQPVPQIPQQIPQVGNVPILHHPPQPPPNNPQQHIDVGNLVH